MCFKPSDYDSRGPGWYCHVDNRWNPMSRKTCFDCGGVRCKDLKD